MVEGETLLSFVQLDDGPLAFVVTSDTVRHSKLDLKSETLHAFLSELSFVCENSVFDRADTSSGRCRANVIIRELRDALLDPVLDWISGEKLLILVDGEFAQIPFWAMQLASDEYVHERFDLRVISDPGDILRSRSISHIKKSARSYVLAIASDELPMIRSETGDIAASFPRAKIRADGKATIESLASALRDSNGFVHVATHASRSSENPLFSKLLMSDGPFFPFDLFEGGVSAELVVLSGCQTAAPGIYYGNTFSLAKAFYQAGARYVLASLWPISDKISMLFMKSLYESLSDGKDIPSAYAEALSAIRSVNANEA
jgi:CHAT domain-containing protein